jgi:hypothetical protein
MPGDISKKMLKEAFRQGNAGVSGKKVSAIRTLLEQLSNNDRHTGRHSKTEGVQDYGPLLDRVAMNRGRMAQVEMRVENRARIRQQPPRNETATFEALPQATNVPWEIFPPGTIDEVVRFFIEGMKDRKGGSATALKENVLRERVEAFMALKPEAYIRGRNQLNGYIGAKLSEDLVVFENWHYGYALYVLHEDWEQISKRSRIELVRDANAGTSFERIIHTPGWQQRLEEKIRRERT